VPYYFSLVLNEQTCFGFLDAALFRIHALQHLQGFACSGHGDADAVGGGDALGKPASSKVLTYTVMVLADKPVALASSPGA